MTVDHAAIRESLIAAARGVARALAERGAQQVLLFGSLARRGALVGVDSDVDLVVVMPGAGNERFHKRLRNVPEIRDFPYPLDLLVYTPEEWARVRRRSFFEHEVLREGIVLYEQR